MKKVLCFTLALCLSVFTTCHFAYAEDEILTSPAEETVITDTSMEEPVITEPVVAPELTEASDVTPDVTQTPDANVPEVSPTTVPVAEPDNYEGSMQFSTTISPTVVSVTIPLNIDVYIDPNDPNGFIHGAIEIHNNVAAPVVVSIKEFEISTIPFRTCIAPDELPEGLDWGNMSVSETGTFFSLGIKPISYAGTDWMQEYATDYVYVKDDFVQTELGVIAGNESAYLGLVSNYGKAFTEEKSFQFSATFVVELME